MLYVCHDDAGVEDMDEDMDGKAFLKFSPHVETKKFHQFQWGYAFLLYSIATLYWVTAKDFIQFFNHIKKGVNKDSAPVNRIRFIKIEILKLLHISDGFMYYDPLDEAYHSISRFYLCQPLTFKPKTNNEIEDDEAIDFQWYSIKSVKTDHERNQLIIEVLNKI